MHLNNIFPVTMSLILPDSGKFEDLKGVIGSRKSQKDKQYTRSVNRKRTSNNVQNITQKTKDRATRIPLNTVASSGAPEG